MIHAILRTRPDAAALVTRIALGLVLLPHGLQKVFGWFGGHGFAGTMGFFTETLGIPWILAFLVIVTESAGAVALLAGFVTRVAAFGAAAVMTVAALLVHVQHGFFMNWSGAQAGEGFEYHVLAAGMAVALMIRGGGLASVDLVLGREAS